MGIEQFSIQALIALSGFLGIASIPVASGTGWSVEKAWHSENGRQTMTASSTAIVETCRANPASYIKFPMVIHGVHTLAVDGHVILQTGDPTFNQVSSFYGAPSLKCRDVTAGTTLSWRVDSYAHYFARFGFFPEVVPHIPLHNVFAESIHVIGAGGALIMAFFALTIFFGKVRRELAWSVALSCLSASVYFAGCASGLFGLSWSMLGAHKFADMAAWCAIALIVNALRIEGFLSNRFFLFYLANLIVGEIIISLGSSGDMIQLGTSLPFGCSVLMLTILFSRAVMRLKGHNFDRRQLLHALSLFSFVAACFNEILVISGIVQSVPMFPIGFLGGVFLLTLAVNERILETYRERDYLRENLEAEVERQTRELSRKTQELEGAMTTLRTTQAELVQSAKLASLGTLSAGIAHEINNSLNYVNGAMQPLEKLVHKQIAPEERAKIDRLFGVMKEGLSLTLEIIKSLRSYTGLNQAKFNDVNILGAANTTLAILRSKTRGKIEVSVEIPEHLQVFGSVVGLNQVFMNLISNSVDAMKDGGQLSITSREIGAEPNQMIEVRVSDTGCGMSKETAARIFEPFFTTKDVGSGTGLGLHIVRGEIDRHQGSVQVESELGKGTTFIICLPKHAHRDTIPQQDEPALISAKDSTSLISTQATSPRRAS